MARRAFFAVFLLLAGCGATESQRIEPGQNAELTGEGLKENPNERLLSFYTNKSNYDVVAKEVWQWTGLKKDTCVAYMSTALRHSNVFIPRDVKIEGYSVSLVTRAFSKYLQNTYGWKKVTSMDDLKPGDIVFTKDHPQYPGFPWHTYMFQSWHDVSKKIALAVDNQGFTHERFVGPGNPEHTPFAYALRAPE